MLGMRVEGDRPLESALFFGTDGLGVSCFRVSGACPPWGSLGDQGAVQAMQDKPNAVVVGILGITA